MYEDVRDTRDIYEDIQGNKWMYNVVQRSIQAHGQVACGDLRFHVIWGKGLESRG